MNEPSLSVELASRFADIALDNLAREYPHKLDHVMTRDADVLPPRVLHPAFHASFDWHSCVHMHWLVVHLRRCFPDLPQVGAIEAVCAQHFSHETIAAECAYLARPHTQSFERTYGWAWLLKLALELSECSDAIAAAWRESLAPLAHAIEARYLDYLPRADYPIRYGMHSNSAFGLAFALDYARAEGRDALERACVDRAVKWHGADVDAPGAWEPSGADFLSPALMEAALMSRVLDDVHAFAGWLGGFLPQLTHEPSMRLLHPVAVSDRDDPQIVHLDGLNLSRAWCWYEIAHSLPANDERVKIASDAARLHLQAGVPAIDGASYVGSHWLASFAALALSASSESMSHD